MLLNRRFGREVNLKALRTIVTEAASTFLSVTPDKLAGAGFEASVGGTGEAYDNALAEKINGLY
jgi:hypothetical protein